ncbi:MAG TPA: phosphate signaling complex protein PhoU [Fimbriimonadaceae bacterium]|nr:phosphate signaling complex protein PhoU [Fimbriimonadaceae bacterium]
MESPNYARHGFAQEMSELEHDLLEMGSRAESMIGGAVSSLVSLDSAHAFEVIQRDDEIDERDLAIESKCLRLLALQQPMASDLRVIGTAMKMITDIERVGDLAVDIAKIGLKIDKELGHTDYVDLPRIAGLAQAMFRGALEAFVRRDLELVKSVCAQDDEVDNLYRELRGQIHEKMRTDPDQVVAASWMLLAIHHIERIADHAVNIAERVSFMVTGNLEQIATSHRSDLPHA